MKIPFKKHDLVIALILALPVGGFIYGFWLTDETAFAHRIVWGLWGALAFLRGEVGASAKGWADEAAVSAILAAFVAVLVIPMAIRSWANLQFTYKKPITLGGAAAAVSLLLFLLLKPEPEDSALVRFPENFADGSTLEAVVNVPRHRLYYIDLQFNYRGDDEQNSVLALVGESESTCHARRECGIAIDLDVTVRDARGFPVQDQLHIARGPAGYYAHGLNSYWRHAGSVPLKPGQYTFTVKAIDVDRKIQSAQVYLLIHPDLRGGTLEGPNNEI